MAQLNDPNGEIVPEEIHINVDHLNEVLADSMSNKLHDLWGQTGQSKPLTISRVPEYIRNKHKELYEPQMISIGPYHHGAKSLELMEEQKWRDVQTFLIEQYSGNLIDLVKEVRSLEVEARSAYEENVCLNSDEFVQMMVLDGCYILGYIFDNEVVCSSISITSDLFLLENQIPFFILQRLYFKIFPKENNCNHLYFCLAKFMFKIANAGKLEYPTQCPVHLVHLYYHWFLLTRAPLRTAYCNQSQPSTVKAYTSSKKTVKAHTSKCVSKIKWKTKHTNRNLGRSISIPKIKLTTTAPIMVIPTATALKEAGVKFKRRTSSRDLFRVTFRKGVMKISSIILDTTRKCLFLNLIAFEQSQAKREKDLTSFAKLMDMLIDTPKDVAILEKAGILHNLLASAEEASHFFNQICECATIDYNNNYLAGVIQDVRQYCNSPWHKHRARLMRDYFNNPWSIISLVAGIILLILSFLQVYFTVMPPKHW